MTTRFTRVQPALAHAAAHPDADLSLDVLAARAGLSAFHLHRLFTTVAGETPKAYTLRLRVSLGACLLLTTTHPVRRVALSSGFSSHEAFIRAFKRQFGITPRAYRVRGFAGTVDRHTRTRHVVLVRQVAPCVHLFGSTLDPRADGRTMSYDIVKKELAPQPVLVVRRRVKRSEIAAAIGSALPLVFQYAQQHGLALSGHPFTRYVEIGAGLLTIEPGMRVNGPARRSGEAASSRSDVIEDVLPGGSAVVTVHNGPYDSLAEAYGAVEAWIETQGLSRAGAPWESYLTDPAEHPDPKEWKTEICWPVSA